MNGGVEVKRMAARLILAMQVSLAQVLSLLTFGTWCFRAAQVTRVCWARHRLQAGTSTGNCLYLWWLVSVQSTTRWLVRDSDTVHSADAILSLS